MVLPFANNTFTPIILVPHVTLICKVLYVQHTVYIKNYIYASLVPNILTRFLLRGCTFYKIQILPISRVKRTLLIYELSPGISCEIPMHELVSFYVVLSSKIASNDTFIVQYYHLKQDFNLISHFVLTKSLGRDILIRQEFSCSSVKLICSN